MMSRWAGALMMWMFLMVHGHAKELRLESPADPNRFIETLGEQAGLWGSLNSGLELWVYPFKTLDSLGFWISSDNGLTYQPLQPYARTQSATPHAAEVQFSAPNGELDLTLFVPRRSPSLVAIVSNRSHAPVLLQARCRPVLGPMHLDPPKLLEFPISGALAREPHRNVSLWADAAVPVRRSKEGGFRTLTVTIPKGKSTIPLVFVMTSGGEREPPELKELLRNHKKHFRSTAQYYDHLLARAARVQSPDPYVDAALAWSVVSLDQFRVRNPDLGYGLVSGFSPSEDSTRPRYCWFFEEPTLTSWAFHWAGLSGHIAESLRFLQQYQRADGKTVHEVTQSLRYWNDYFEKFRYAYMHTDGPLYYLAAYEHHYRTTGDLELINREWPRIERTLEWCLSVMDPEDGLLRIEPGMWGSAENSLEVWKDTQLEAMWVRALRSVAVLAAARGDEQMRSRCEMLASRALASLESKLWDEPASNYLWGLDRKGKPLRSLVPHHAIGFWLSELRPDRVKRALERMGQSDFRTDWGVRSLAMSDPAYDAAAYQSGSVWPVWNAGVIIGDYRHGRAVEGFRNWQAMVRCRTLGALGRMPEVLSGRRFELLPEAVPHQMFSELAVQNGFYDGLLGLEVDVPSKVLKIAPRLPPTWARVRVERVRFGTGWFDLELRQRGTGLDLTCEVNFSGGTTLKLAPGLPAGCEVDSVQVDGRASPYNVRRGFEETVVEIQLPKVKGSTTVQIRHRLGVSFLPRDIELEPGASSTNLRVIRAGLFENTWRAKVEGLPGRRYEIELFTDRKPGDPKGGKVTSPSRDRLRFQTRAPCGALTNVAGYAAWELEVPLRTF